MAISWMKKGVESAKAVEKADQEAALKQQQNSKMWRFWLNKGEEARVTFIDGNLTKEGVLDIMTFREHQIFMNGSWNNHFVCTQDVEPCPICEGSPGTQGDTPSLVGVLTIIDHRTVKSNDGTKTYKDQQRLFVAKRDTIKLLQNIAVKRGGLAGATFDIMRQGDRSASVGSNFDFIEKNDIEALRAQYTKEILEKDGKTKKTVTAFLAANYEEEIIYRSAVDLRGLGFGNQNILGGESAPMDSGPSKNYDDQL